MVLVFADAPVSAESVSTSAEAFELFCVENGEVMLSQNPDRQLPMASTTKIMTALLTLEEAEKDNRIVTFTEDMTAEGSSMYLKIGEKVRLYDVAVGMMMQSGNDAANAAAIATAGSIEAFAEKMNEKAHTIGMEHTHFVTPSGLDDSEHYSTAHDMAMLMAYAMQNEMFAEMTAQTSMTVDFIEPSDKSVTYANHNRLLKMYEDCIGGKTGYTERSGRCLVTAARRGGMTLVAVTLNDRDDWDDHIALYDFGFENYTSVQPEVSDYEIAVVGGTADTVKLSAERPVPVILPREEAGNLEERLILPAFVYAPLQKGERVGEIRYILDGKTLLTVPLLADEAVEYNSRKRSFIDYIKDIFNFT